MALKVTDFSYTLKKQHKKTVTKVIFFILLYFFIINFILTFLIFPVRQLSSSMQPNIMESSCLMVTTLLKNPDRGDIVLLKARSQTKEGFFKKILNKTIAFFTAQQIFLNEMQDSPCVKNELRRVVGLPGDTIYMRDYILYICPENEKYFLTEFEVSPKKYSVAFFTPPSTWDTSIGVSGSFEKITLKDDEYFLLGDNRKSCDDSRLWGPVKLSSIKAKALFTYFPFTNLKLY